MVKTPQPVIHNYKEVNKGKYKTVRHFELSKVINGKSKIVELINIRKNQNCAMSMPSFWLKGKQGKKWTKNYLTGLFKTEYKNIYKGDINRRKHLLIFKFNNEVEGLLIYYFQNYYTNDLRDILSLIND